MQAQIIMSADMFSTASPLPASGQAPLPGTFSCEGENPFAWILQETFKKIQTIVSAPCIARVEPGAEMSECDVLARSDLSASVVSEGNRIPGSSMEQRNVKDGEGNFTRERSLPETLSQAMDGPVWLAMWMATMVSAPASEVEPSKAEGALEEHLCTLANATSSLHAIKGDGDALSWAAASFNAHDARRVSVAGEDADLAEMIVGREKLAQDGSTNEEKGGVLTPVRVPRATSAQLQNPFSRVPMAPEKWDSGRLVGMPNSGIVDAEKPSPSYVAGSFPPHFARAEGPANTVSTLDPDLHKPVPGKVVLHHTFGDSFPVSEQQQSFQGTTQGERLLSTFSFQGRSSLDGIWREKSGHYVVVPMPYSTMEDGSIGQTRTSSVESVVTKGAMREDLPATHPLSGNSGGLTLFVGMLADRPTNSSNIAPRGGRISEDGAPDRFALSPGAVPEASHLKPLIQADSSGRMGDVHSEPTLRGNDGKWLAPAAQQIWERLAHAIQRGESECQLELHPAWLGKVRGHLAVSGDTVIMTLSVETRHAEQAIYQGLPELRQALEARGLELGRCDIGLAGQSSGAPGQFSDHRLPERHMPESDGRRPIITEPETVLLAGVRNSISGAGVDIQI